MERGFLASLFDVSFESLITTTIIKVVYVLYMIVIGLIALGFTVAAFHASTAAGIFTLLIGAPLASLMYLILVRVFLEAIIALFRIMENTQLMVASGGSVTSPGVAGAAIPGSSQPTASPSPPAPGPLPPQA